VIQNRARRRETFQGASANSAASAGRIASAAKSRVFAGCQPKIPRFANRAFGNRWTLIAAQMEGRTDNDLKDRCNSPLKGRIPQSESSA
jgi:hypothetical protein